MDSIQSFQCSFVEQLMHSFWPDWYVTRHIGAGSFSDVFEIQRDYYGIRSVAALKVITFFREGSLIRLSPFWDINALIGDNAVSFTQKERNGGFSRDIAYSEDFCAPSWFADEINTMKRINGAPNVVSIEDFHIHTFRFASQNSQTDPEQPQSDNLTIVFIRMELMTRLPELVRSRFPSLSLSAGEVRKLGMDICRALTYCENNKIRGLEINPENLFIDRFGNYKIGVFSIAHYQESDRPAHNRAGIGAVSYLPPEVSSGDIGSSTSDTYSLGLVLYELLNEGRSPFLPLPPLGCSSSQVDAANMRRFHGEPLPPPAQADPGMWKIIKKACEHLPENRYQSAGEFYAALSAYRMSEGSPASSQETSGSGTESVSASAAVHSASSPVMGSGQDETLRSWDDTAYRWEDTAFSDPVQQEFPDPYQTKREEDFSQEIPPSELSPESRNKPSQYNRGPAQQTKTGETQSDSADVPGTTTAGVPGEGPGITEGEPPGKTRGTDNDKRDRKKRSFIPFLVAGLAAAVVAAVVAARLLAGCKAPVRSEASAAVSSIFAGFPAQAAQGAVEFAGEGREKINKTPVEISDPVLRNSILSALNISGDTLRLCDVRDVAELDLEITEADKDKKITKLAGLENFYSLQKLSMRKCGLSSDADFSVLKDLPDLQILDLHDNQISKLDTMFKLRKLTWLNLSKNKVTNVAHLKMMTGLQTLALYHNEITDISKLEKLTGLKELYIDDNKITDLTPLKNMKELEILRADENQITNISSLGQLKKLKELVLSDNKITDASAIGSLSGLKELWIDNNQITKTDFLKGLTGMTYLNLEGNGTEDISSIGKLSGLTDLVLAKNKITDLSPLKSLTRLKYLDLDENSTADLAPLQNLTALETLYLNSNAVTDLSPLKGLKNLKTLALGNNTIQDVSVLGKLSTLESLDLYSNSITDISSLAGLTKLTWLNIGRNNVSDISAVTGMKKLETLQIYRNTIGSLSPLEGIKSLEYLVADNNSIQDLQPLQHLDELRYLYLEYNNIKDISPLKDLKKLEKLYLAGNAITDYTPLDSLPKDTKVYRESQY